MDELPVALAFDGQHPAASSLKQSLSMLIRAPARSWHASAATPSALIWADLFLWTANDIAGTVTKVSLMVRSSLIRRSARAIGAGIRWFLFVDCQQECKSLVRMIPVRRRLRRP
jgi:hypothetical protein